MEAAVVPKLDMTITNFSPLWFRWRVLSRGNKVKSDISCLNIPNDVSQALSEVREVPEQELSLCFDTYYCARPWARRTSHVPCFLCFACAVIIALRTWARWSLLVEIISLSGKKKKSIFGKRNLFSDSLPWGEDLQDKRVFHSEIFILFPSVLGSLIKGIVYNACLFLLRY